jgi:L-lactate dehydrogenase complex protein LldG
MSDNSRQTILNQLRRQLPPAQALPALDDDWTTYPDPLQQFSTVLAGVGGNCVAVPTLADINAALARIQAYSEARIKVSQLPGVGEANLNLHDIPDPHQLEAVDFAIVPGQYAIAENAAVWLDDAHVRHRVLYFITQHLAIVVPRSGLLHNLHEAYARLQVSQRPFGIWISGPSKTADIEQSLVIGAHGARSLTVFLVDDWAGSIP